MENNDNEQLDQMFGSILGSEGDTPAAEIENINELVEQEIQAEAETVVEAVTNNPLVLSNGGWSDFCNLSPLLNILDLTNIVDQPVVESQVIIGERLSRSLSTRIVAVDQGCVIPLLTDATNTLLYSCNDDGNPLAGFIIKQQKTVEASEGITGGHYQHYCYVPFETKSRKLVAFSKDRMVYHVSTTKSDEESENVNFVESTRHASDLLTEEDRIHIKSKFSKKKLAEEWNTLGDALRDIWATIHSTLDVNYQRKMLELNKTLCYSSID